MTSSAATSGSKTLIVGLSGPSSSGKTTLARLLRQIFNCNPSILKLFIIHEDDFYKTDKLIPRKTFSSAEFGTRELDDWDCVESLDLPLLRTVLGDVKREGALPPDFASKEDKNTVGESGVGAEQVEELQRKVKLWLNNLSTGVGESSGVEWTICLLDGFLIYPNPMSKEGTQEKELHDILAPLLSLKLFLPSSKSQTIDRRTKRTGYVTLEGFWEDPPGYVEDVVWPNYAKDHYWLFSNSAHQDEAEVMKAIDEGRVNRDLAKKNDVLVGPGTGEAHLREILPWAIEKLNQSLKV